MDRPKEQICATPFFLLPLSNADVAAEGLQIHRSLAAKVRTEEAVGGGLCGVGARCWVVMGISF